MKKYLLVVIVFLQVGFVFGRNANFERRDSLNFNAVIGLMGRWQTGNLNQFSLMPNVNFSLSNESFFTQINSKYEYIIVEDFNIVNDFWTNGIFQYQQQNRWFLAAASTAGFAKSYKIDHSVFVGGGVGVNLLKNSANKYFQFHGLAGYLDFKFENQTSHSALALGSLIRAKFPISEQINFKWDLATFHSTKEIGFWGGGNLFEIQFIVVKKLMMNVSHQTFFNNKTVEGIQKINSQMLFGIQYSIN